MTTVTTVTTFTTVTTATTVTTVLTATTVTTALDNSENRDNSTFWRERQRIFPFFHWKERGKEKGYYKLIVFIGVGGKSCQKNLF